MSCVYVVEVIQDVNSAFSPDLSALELPLDCYTPLHYSRRPGQERPLGVWSGVSAPLPPEAKKI